MNHGAKKDLVPTCVFRLLPSSAMTAEVIVLSVHVGRRDVIIVVNGNEELEVPPLTTVVPAGPEGLTNATL
jgi:hypothetical protein